MRVYYLSKGIHITIAVISILLLFTLHQLCARIDEETLMSACGGNTIVIILDSTRSNSTDTNILLNPHKNISNEVTSNDYEHVFNTTSSPSKTQPSRELSAATEDFLSETTTSRMSRKKRALHMKDDESSSSTQSQTVISAVHIHRCIQFVYWTVLLLSVQILFSIACVANVYTTIVPPSQFSDFLRNFFQSLVWLGIYVIVFIKAYHWRSEWESVSNEFYPEFPWQWRSIQILACTMIMLNIVEAYLHRILYADIKIHSNFGVYEVVDNSGQKFPSRMGSKNDVEA